MPASSDPPILQAYARFLQQPDVSATTAAIRALTEDIRSSTATTMMGLLDALRQGSEALKQSPDAPIALASLCELFVRFVTRAPRPCALLSFRCPAHSRSAQTARPSRDGGRHCQFAGRRKGL